MTVKELIEELKKHPEHLDVFINTEDDCDFQYKLLESIKFKNVGFAENPGDEPMAHEDVISLSADI